MCVGLGAPCTLYLAFSVICYRYDQTFPGRYVPCWSYILVVHFVPAAGAKSESWLQSLEASIVRALMKWCMAECQSLSRAYLCAVLSTIHHHIRTGGEVEAATSTLLKRRRSGVLNHARLSFTVDVQEDCPKFTTGAPQIADKLWINVEL